jgi:hypothetical protein
MIFNDRRKNRIQSATEREHVNALVKNVGHVVYENGKPANRKGQYAAAARAVDAVYEENKRK